jgi:hypothetical protein
MVLQDVDGTLLLVRTIFVRTIFVRTIVVRNVIGVRTFVSELDFRPFVDQDEGEFDVPEVFYCDNHVVEDGDVFAVKAEQAFERHQRTHRDEKGQEIWVRLKNKFLFFVIRHLHYALLNILQTNK